MRSAARWLLALTLLAQAWGAAGAQGLPAAESARPVVLTELQGTIGPAAVDHVRRTLELALDEQARLVVFLLDTPGGLDASTREIVDTLRASSVPIATFVAPGPAHADGAGLEILRASHVAAMVPGAALGPASATGPTGPAGTPVVAQDVSDLLRQLHGRELATGGGKTTPLATQGVQVLVFDDDGRYRLLAFLTHPGAVLALLTGGVFALLFGFFGTGRTWPSVLGAAALTTAVFGLWLLPLDLAGLGLVLAGLVLWVVPAFARWPWVWTAAGVAAFAFGALRLIDNPVPGFGVPPWMVVALCAAGVAFDIALARAAARARRPPPPVAGVSTLVGLTGELVEFADGEGWAQIEGDYWHVQGDLALRAGRRVRVTRVQGLALQVAAEGQEAGGDAGGVAR